MALYNTYRQHSLGCILLAHILLFHSTFVYTFRTNSTEFTSPILNGSTYPSAPKSAHNRDVAYAVSHALEGETISNALQPIRNYILVKRQNEPSQSKGGVFLPQSVRNDDITGEIIAIGEGQISYSTGKRIPMIVNVGDQVLFPKHAGETVQYDGSECVLVSADEVLAKLAKPQIDTSRDIVPLGDNILIRLLKERTQTSSGLFMAGSNESKSLQQAEVVSTGNGRFDEQLNQHKPDVKAGDKVLYSTYATESSILKLGNEAYSFVKAHEIIARF